MLEAQNLECTRGDRVLFRHIDLCVQAGEILRVAGQNGAGKTSLLRILCGLIRPTEGVVRYMGQAVLQDRERLAADLRYVGHLNGLKEDLSAFENLELLVSVADPGGANSLAETLSAWGLAGREHLPVRDLSQGQRRRVALARLNLGSSRLWLLDEPLTALDEHASKRLGDCLRKHLGAGGAVVLTTHQLPSWNDLPVTTLNLSGESH